MVAPLIRAVIREGDRALVRYARRWDGFEGAASDLAVSRSEIAAAQRTVGHGFLGAVREAARNIRDFCRLPDARRVDANHAAGRSRRATDPAARKRGVLHPRGTVSSCPRRC